MFRSTIRRVSLSLACLTVFVSVPAFSEAYQINPGDILRIDVWNEEDLSREVLVRPDGFVSLPMAGDIDANGSSPPEVAGKIAESLSKYMRNVPQVVVSLVQTAGNSIFVIGKVLQPGQFVLTSETDVMQALALAGGLNSFADENDILILRRDKEGTQRAIPFEYSRVKVGKDLETNIILQSKDIVVVP